MWTRILGTTLIVALLLATPVGTAGAVPAAGDGGATGLDAWTEWMAERVAGWLAAPLALFGPSEHTGGSEPAPEWDTTGSGDASQCTGDDGASGGGSWGDAEAGPCIDPQG